MVLKNAKTTQKTKKKKQQRDVFLLSASSFCRNFLEFGIRRRLHLHLCTKRTKCLGKLSGLPVQQSRTGSHLAATYFRTGAFRFLLCFRKRVLLLNLVLYDPPTLRRRFTLKTHQMFSPHTTRRNLKLKGNNHRPFWTCAWEKLGQGNHIIIATPSFSKSSVFKMFSDYVKTKSRRFLIPLV